MNGLLFAKPFSIVLNTMCPRSIVNFHRILTIYKWTRLPGHTVYGRRAPDVDHRKFY